MKVAAIILGIVLAAGVVPAAGDQVMTREQALAALANRAASSPFCPTRRV